MDTVVEQPRSKAPVKTPRRALNGVLVLDKPLGWTSNDALQKAKGLLRALKGGHTGTLDPLATGVLPLCFGAATKFSQASLDADKRYTATLQLGQRTSTGDREGDVVEERAVAVSRADIDAACARFTGDIDQVPPMHSALKHEGRALYEYARAGQTVEREARRVRIHSIDVVSWSQSDKTLVLDVACSKGTYIRTLAEDIGTALGCGAHLSGLRRTASGTLVEAHCTTLEALAELSEDARATLLRPADTLLQDMPAIVLPPEEAARFITGLRRRTTQADEAAVRVYAETPRAFLGTAHIAGGELIATRLLNPTEIEPDGLSDPP
jgi:tRNA pseudouridine55 synthase